MERSKGKFNWINLIEYFLMSCEKGLVVMTTVKSCFITIGFSANKIAKIANGPYFMFLANGCGIMGIIYSQVYSFTGLIHSRHVVGALMPRNSHLLVDHPRRMLQYGSLRWCRLSATHSHSLRLEAQGPLKSERLSITHSLWPLRPTC